MDRAAPKLADRAADAMLRPIGFADVPGWEADDHAAALTAFHAGATLIADTAPKQRALGIDGGGLQRVAHALLAEGVGPDRLSARKFLERHFSPFRVDAAGFVTGYFEPEVFASPMRTERFAVPLYRRPPDLVEVADANRPQGWDPEIRFARAGPSGLSPYFDRAAIEMGVLDGLGLEIAFLESPVDAFFIHVQGSARLRFPDGGLMRVGFDGKSGHAYTSIGRLAVERGILLREKADKDGLETWLKSHPAEGRALMRENRSFIFFRETGQGVDDGPLGAAGVPLTRYRSLAVDRTLHTFHTPVWVDAPALADPEGGGAPFRRLMIAQDTGSAIVGPARGDIFFGAGTEAGSRAGRVRHAASMIALVPNDLQGGR